MNLPDFEHSGSQVTGNIDAPAIKRQLFRSIRRNRPIVEDAELSGWLNNLVNRLTRHAPGVGNDLFVVIENNPAINAYALTGGIIVVNSGLILSTGSESELAAVLAHEIAHVSQRHLTRMYNDQKNSPLLTGLGILAGAAVSGKSPEAAQAIITGTMAIQAQQQVSYSQQYESEADRVGLRILAGAGFNANAMATFLEKLERNESNTLGNLSKYLRSHPLSIERLSDTRTRAGSLRNPVRESTDYLYAREKLRAIYQPDHNNPAQGLTPALSNYYQALQQFRRDNHPAVINILGTRATQLPAALLIARSLNALQRFTEAEQLLKPLQNQYPQNTSINLLLAQAVSGKGDKQYAWQLINRIRTTESTSLEFFETAQNIAQQAGQQHEAIIYTAERNLRLGEYKYARLALEQSLRTQPANHIKARLQQKLNEVIQAQNELDYLK
ncbi:MAG: M48 family metalloprotease [Thiolinea sp.]